MKYMKELNINYVKLALIVILITLVYVIYEIRDLKNKKSIEPFESINTESLSSLASMYNSGVLQVKSIETTGDVKISGKLNVTNEITSDNNINSKKQVVGNELKSDKNVYVGTGNNKWKMSASSNETNMVEFARDNGNGWDSNKACKIDGANGFVVVDKIKTGLLKPIHNTSSWDAKQIGQKTIDVGAELGDMVLVRLKERGDYRDRPSIVGIGRGRNPQKSFDNKYKMYAFNDVLTGNQISDLKNANGSHQHAKAL